MRRITDLESPYSIIDWKVKIPPHAKIKIVLEWFKEKIRKLINTSKLWETEDINEILLKSDWKTSSFFKYVRSVLWTTQFDFELLLWILEKIKYENLNWARNRKGKKYSINFHLDTFLDPRFVHLLQEVKKISWIHKLDSIKIEILEEPSRKSKITEVWMKSIAKNIKILQEEWVEVWLDDYWTWNNKEKFLGDLAKQEVELDFVKIDWWEVIKFFTSQKDQRTQENEAQLTAKIIKLVTEIKASYPNNTKIILEWIANKDALDWLETKFNWEIHYYQWFVTWKPKRL